MRQPEDAAELHHSGDGVEGFDLAGQRSVRDGLRVPRQHEVATRLVTDLVDRGLDASHGVLFVVDGGKALAKAIRVTFGDKALIARCRRHKERNVLDHLPEAERPLVQRRLRDAWATPDADTAARQLESIARSLDKKRPGRPPACAKDSPTPSPSTGSASPARCSRPSSRPTRSSR